jgi:flagellar hook protein FlgE
MSSFSIPLSGLEASSDSLNVIANNLANLNTDGYKDQTLNFGDIFFGLQGSSGNGDPIQVGSGVQIDGTTANFTNGNLDSTGIAANMGLQGNGFFVVGDGKGSMNFTRAGDFSVNSSGQLIDPAGELVLGYQAVNGVITTSGGLSPITVNQSTTTPAVPTTTFQTDTNLQAGSPVGTTFNTPISVIDSLGATQTMNIEYTNTGTNTWSYKVSLAPQTLTNATPGGNTTTFDFGTSGATVATVDPGTNLTITGPTATGTATIIAPTVTAGETVANYATALQAAVTASGITGVTVTATGGKLAITGTGVTTSGTVAQDPVAAGTTGTLTFDSSGNLVSPTGSITGINFSGLSDGAAPMNLSWNLDGASGTPSITQEATTSANSTTTQNGFGVGTLTGFVVSPDGVVEGQYSNDQTQALGQVAVASFSNVNGLTQSTDGEFQATTASGVAVIGQAGAGGNGTIAGGEVEESNVDLSTEFSNMIVAQQNYEANAKALTAFDQISQATIQLIS